MTEPLSTDLFASLEQCNNFTMPPFSHYDVFPQFDPSTFISTFDLPDNSTSSSDNEVHSPTYPIPSLLPSSPAYVDALNDSSTIGVKRKTREVPVTLPGIVVDELIKSQEEKKLRLARKAELARQSRRKKKMRMNDLENDVSDLQRQLELAKDEIKKLQDKNSFLLQSQSHHHHVTVSKTATSDQLITEILKLNGMLPKKAPTTPLSNVKKNEEKTQEEKNMERLISELIFSFQKDTSVRNSNLQNLQQDLVPSMAIQFLEWTLTRGDQFYNDGTQFGHLFDETMQSTPTQISQLLSLRKSNEESKITDAKVLEALETLKQAFAQRTAQVETFSKLSAIFTPQQFASFLHYVKMFGHVLIKVPA